MASVRLRFNHHNEDLNAWKKTWKWIFVYTSQYFLDLFEKRSSICKKKHRFPSRYHKSLKKTWIASLKKLTKNILRPQWPSVYPKRMKSENGRKNLSEIVRGGFSTINVRYAYFVCQVLQPLASSKRYNWRLLRPNLLPQEREHWLADITILRVSFW